MTQTTKKLNKTYFVTSDIHSFYTPLRQSLDGAGFDVNNPNHILIICGDVFDRGAETVKLFDFIMSIPKCRRILVKGNHEYLYEELLHKDFPDTHDFSNGTVKTFCQIAGVDPDSLSLRYWKIKYIEEQIPSFEYVNKPYEVWQNIKEKVKKSNITKWIKSKEWKNYYELDQYIFVHSFIPAKVKEEYSFEAKLFGEYYLKEDCFEYDQDWRNSDNWFDAVWGCPWRKYQAGLFAPEVAKGKILVCGHWHAYDFRIHLNNIKYERDEDIDFSTYVSDNLIALDACTALSGINNVFVFEK